MTGRRLAYSISLAGAIFAGAGCESMQNFYNRVVGTVGPQQVTADQFMRPERATTVTEDQTPAAASAPRVVTPTPTPQAPLSNRDIADVVQRAIREPDFSPHPTTQPLSTQPTELTQVSGQYM